MAHELDYNAVTGSKSMFYVGETPWHYEGVGLTEAPNLAEAIRLAGSGYEVRCQPVYTRQPDGTFKATETGQAIFRADTGKVFGLTGDGYAPLQNWDAFAVLEPLLDRGVATLETGGTLREGADAWMLVKFNIDDAVVREVFASEIVPYALISNNHSAARAARIMETPIRVVCANTLGAAHRASGGVTIKHTATVRVRMVEAAELMFAKLTERYRVIAEDYRTLKGTILSVEAFERAVLNTVVPMPQGTDVQKFVIDRALDRRNELSRMWDAGKGHAADHSAWEAYNGAVEVLDHDSDTFKVRGSRVESMAGGRIATLKSEVLDAVLAECSR